MESAILKFPAIMTKFNRTSRSNRYGTIILSGFEPDIVLDSIKVVIEEGTSIQKYAGI